MDHSSKSHPSSLILVMVKGLQTSHNWITDIRHYLPKEWSAMYRSRGSIAHFTIKISTFLLAKLSKTLQRKSLMPKNKSTHDSSRMHLRSSSSPLSHFACLSVSQLPLGTSMVWNPQILMEMLFACALRSLPSVNTIFPWKMLLTILTIPKLLQAICFSL